MLKVLVNIGLAVGMLFVFTKSFASEIRYIAYQYQGNVVKTLVRDTFVICNNCPERVRLEVGTIEKADAPVKQAVSPIAIRIPQPPQELPLPQQEPPYSPCCSGSELDKELQPSVRKQSNLWGVVYFDFDSSNLRPEEQGKLLSLIQEGIKDEVVIEGHTCNVGSERYNLMLSRKRASVVADFLRDRGINIKEIEGKGEQSPTSKKKYLNRRVEILWR